jgi:hypothetical protein
MNEKLAHGKGIAKSRGRVKRGLADFKPDAARPIIRTPPLFLPLATLSPSFPRLLRTLPPLLLAFPPLFLRLPTLFLRVPELYLGCF